LNGLMMAVTSFMRALLVPFVGPFRLG